MANFCHQRYRIQAQRESKQERTQENEREELLRCTLIPLQNLLKQVQANLGHKRVQFELYR